MVAAKFQNPAVKEPSNNYRPDVDGLRAIAVSGVVLYHLHSVDFLPGGFLGVDIFFVISGFLIAKVILKGIREKNFSFKKFYLRRARRLLPAFFLVAITTSAAAYVFLEPTRMLDFTHSLLFSTLGLSNFYFMFQDPYWADSVSTLPFLHTWSLAVEEQFYLFFPAVLFFASKLLKGSRLIILFVVLGFLSLALAYWVSEVNPTFAFYLFPTRAWELLIGVSLALVLDHANLRLSKLLAALLTAVGLILILISYIYLGQFISAPGILTVVPTFGAALIIVGGITPNLVSRYLGMRLLAGLGMISYSLYLWHYPILALAEVAASNSLPIQIVGVGLALVLSVATYFLVETPFRRQQWNGLFTTAASATVISTLLFSTTSLITEGYKSPSNIPFDGVPQAATLPVPRDAESQLLGAVAIFGDSHMAALAPGLEEKSRSKGLHFFDGTSSGCLFVVGLARASVKESHADCNSGLQDTRITDASVLSPAFVIVGGRYPLALEGDRFDNKEGIRFDNKEGGVEPGGRYLFFSPDTVDFSPQESVFQISESTKNTAEILLRQGNILVLVYPIPEVGWDVPVELTRRSAPDTFAIFGPSTRKYFADRGIAVQWQRFSFQETQWPVDEPVTTSYDVYVERTRSTFELFDLIRGDNVIRIYPHKIFCEDNPGGRCATHSDTEVWYADDDHLSSSGAELLNAEIFKKLQFGVKP